MSKRAVRIARATASHWGEAFTAGLDVRKLELIIGGVAPAAPARDNESMDDALLMHRLHFAFTVTFHYLFPQLTMGLAPLIVILKTLYLRTGNPLYNRAARFWAKVFGVTFRDGRGDRHPHGVPVRHQLGRVLARHRAA